MLPHRLLFLPGFRQCPEVLFCYLSHPPYTGDNTFLFCRFYKSFYFLSFYCVLLKYNIFLTLFNKKGDKKGINFKILYLFQQSVNLLSLTSMVRIHLPPPSPFLSSNSLLKHDFSEKLKIPVLCRFSSFYIKKGDKKGINFFDKKRLTSCQSCGI